MNLLRLMLCLCLGMLTACATPVEVKQALSAKDEHYRENVKLVEQYRQLTENINARFQYWHRYIAIRQKLNLALEWATTNPKPARVTEQEQADLAAELLGADVTAFVNKIRLRDLPARTAPDAKVLFEIGKGDMNGIIQRIPGLLAHVGKQVDADFQHSTRVDLSAFDDYRTNMEVLRRMNAMIKGYLDIDVTVQRGDIKEIADAIKTLH